jgi:hypothetical protein
MENTLDNKANKQRAYFFQQGQSIGKLNDLLNSNIFKHHITKWFSIVLEIGFYLIFLFILFLSILLPTELSYYFSILGDNSLNLSYCNNDITYVFVTIKIFIVLLGLPLFILARLLAINRKKNTLIRAAYIEAEKMKLSFDDAVKTLEL